MQKQDEGFPHPAFVSLRLELESVYNVGRYELNFIKEKYMLKGGAVVCIILNLCACAGTGAGGIGLSRSSGTVDLNYWLTPPRQTELVVMGISPPQSKRELEITAARQDAARKISMYHSVQANIENIQNVGGFLDYFAASDASVEYSQEIDQYLEGLSFDPERDVFTRNNAVFIRFTYPVAFPGTVQYTSGKNSNGSPEWTTNRPQEISGFMAGVGFARKHTRTAETVFKSTESAVVALVSRISSSVNAGETATDTRGGSYVHQQSVGNLSCFLVLETWIDPKTEDVWTLAIAQDANQP